MCPKISPAQLVETGTERDISWKAYYKATPRLQKRASANLHPNGRNFTLRSSNDTEKLTDELNDQARWCELWGLTVVLRLFLSQEL